MGHVHLVPRNPLALQIVKHLGIEERTGGAGGTHLPPNVPVKDFHGAVNVTDPDAEDGEHEEPEELCCTKESNSN